MEALKLVDAGNWDAEATVVAVVVEEKLGKKRSTTLLKSMVPRKEKEALNLYAP